MREFAGPFDTHLKDVSPPKSINVMRGSSMTFGTLPHLCKALHIHLWATFTAVATTAAISGRGVSLTRDLRLGVSLCLDGSGCYSIPCSRFAALCCLCSWSGACVRSVGCSTTCRSTVCLGATT